MLCCNQTRRNKILSDARIMVSIARRSLLSFFLSFFPPPTLRFFPNLSTYAFATRIPRPPRWKVPFPFFVLCNEIPQFIQHRISPPPKNLNEASMTHHMHLQHSRRAPLCHANPTWTLASHQSSWLLCRIMNLERSSWLQNHHRRELELGQKEIFL